VPQVAVALLPAQWLRTSKLVHPGKKATAQSCPPHMWASLVCSKATTAGFVHLQRTLAALGWFFLARQALHVASVSPAGQSWLAGLSLAGSTPLIHPCDLLGPAAVREAQEEFAAEGSALSRPDHGISRGLSAAMMLIRQHW
jgi:hypothetical protein